MSTTQIVNKSLEDALDIVAYKEGEVIITQNHFSNIKHNPDRPTPEDFNDDYNYARKSMKQLIEAGKTAIQGALKIAVDTEHPRAYEVTSTLISQTASVTKELINLSKIVADIDKLNDVKIEEEQEENEFMGSTADLNKLLQDCETSEIKKD
ncbi:MAG: hypothetical protein R8M45_10705 [Ghiorsea sp.]